MLSVDGGSLQRELKGTLMCVVKIPNCDSDGSIPDLESGGVGSSPTTSSLVH